MRLRCFSIPLVVLFAALVAAPAAARETPRRVDTGGPIVAAEDTMRFEVNELFVRATRVTLDEILDRVARGEARRESLLNDQTFTSSARLVHNVVGKKKPELFSESVYRVYKRRPDKLRSVLLRQWELKPDKKGKDGDGDGVNVEFSPAMGERIVNFAFRPEARRDYRYRIIGREIIDNRLIYRIAFEPRSALDVFEPSGEVWVDTREYVIVRQEVTFRGSPVPLFLRSIDRLVVERQRVGDFWVLKRLGLRARLTIPIPTFGNSFDMVVAFTDYAINTGIPDAVFATKPPKRDAKPEESGR